MATITLGTLRDYWKGVYDWVTGASASEPKVVLSGRNSILSGEKVVAAAGPANAAPLAASAIPVASVTIQAKPGNVGSAYIGGSAAQYVELQPGDSVVIPAADVSLAYVYVDNANDGVNWIGIA